MAPAWNGGLPLSPSHKKVTANGNPNELVKPWETGQPEISYEVCPNLCNKEGGKNWRFLVEKGGNNGAHGKGGVVYGLCL